jgi:hypothetical protein
MDPLVRLMALLWGLSIFLLLVVLLIGPRVAARIQYNLNLRRRARNQAAISAAMAQEAREKEQELLATDDDLVGCILCRFDLAGHEEQTS